MKQISIVFISITLLFFACKDKQKIEINPTTNPFEVHPTQYTQNVLLENFTGEWCGNCIENNKFIDTLKKKYPSRFFVSNIHISDWLETPYSQEVTSLLGGVVSYPKGAINRKSVPNTVNQQEDSLVIVSPKNWENVISATFQQIPPLAIALESNKDNLEQVYLNVYISYRQPIAGDLRVMVCALEDDIKAINQSGADTNVNYYHQDVLKSVVSSNYGDTISLNKVNDTIRKLTYTNIDLFNINKEKLSFIVFVYKYNVDYKKVDIINVQKVNYGGMKFWNL